MPRGRPRLHDDAMTPAQRVAASTAALEASGGARKTFRLSPAAHSALKRLMVLAEAPVTETALIERLLLTPARRTDPTAWMAAAEADQKRIQDLEHQLRVASSEREEMREKVNDTHRACHERIARQRRDLELELQAGQRYKDQVNSLELLVRTLESSREIALRELERHAAEIADLKRQLAQKAA